MAARTDIPGVEHPGFEIPGIELVEELGRGAYTVVYRAVRTGGDRGTDARAGGVEQYAVKVLRGAGDERAAAAFRREAALLARLRHPGLVGIHEVGEAAGRPYLIMDLVVGRSLGEVLDDATLDEPRAVEIAQDVVGALGVAHRAGLVHRDIKPENIMIDHDGRAKVIDFGLAVHAGAEAAEVAVGTFVYAAPEQTGVLHRPVDGRSDLYALGIVLFECLTGAPPFAAKDVGELIRMHLSATPPDVRELRAEVSPALAEIIAKLLAKDPDDRYLGGDGLLADLARVASGQREAFELGSADRVAAAEDGLVGREAQVTALRQQWRDTTAGRGGIALIQGAPGAGKSRLAREVTAAAAAGGHIVLYGKSDADSAVPLAPLRAAVDRYIATVAHLPESHRERAVQRLRAAAGPAAAGLRALSPALTELLGVAATPSTEDERQFAVAVANLLAGLARQTGESATRDAKSPKAGTTAKTGPAVILHLDDLQWWDDSTQRVLRLLVPMLADTPLLLLVTARDDAPSQPAVEAFVAEYGTALYTNIALQPLDDAAVEALVVRQLGGGGVPADLVTSLVARSGGNPMAVQEYVRAIVDAGLVRPSWGRWIVDDAGLADLELPDNVADLVVRRVDGLGEEAHVLLTAAAAIGTRFQPDLAATACGVDQAAALATFGDAAAHRLIEPTPAGGFAFLHDRIREALLGKLDDAARRNLHQRLAEALDASDGEHVYEVAHHYLAGELDGPGARPRRAFEAAWAAGSLALTEHAAGLAVELLTAAADVARRAGLELPSEFHAALGVAAGRIGQYGLGDEHLNLALLGETRPLARAKLYMELATTSHLRWEGTRAIEMVRNGLAELRSPMPRNPVALVLYTMIRFVAGVLVGLLPERIRLVRGAAREVYTLRGDLHNAGSASAAMVNQQPLMMAFAMTALILGNRLGHGATYAESQAVLAIGASAANWRAQARRMQARAIAAACATGDPRIVDRMEYLRGVANDIASPIGATSGATLRRVLELHTRGVDSGEHLTGIGCYGGLLILRGYSAQAAALYQRGIDAYGMSGESLGNPFATLGAQAAALSGRPGQAAAQLREVREFVGTLTENRGQLINLAVADIQLAVESAETGDVLDRALEQFALLRANPAFLWAFQRSLWVYQAFGRLAQLAVAPPQRRDERLAQTQRAIRALRRVANGPVLRAYHAAAVANLRQQLGEHDTALRLLAKLEHRAAVLDLPLLGYEVARVRARALRGLDRPEDADRQVAIALLLAEKYGWQTRARWVRAEFDLDGHGRGRGMSQSTRSVSMTHSASTSMTSSINVGRSGGAAPTGGPVNLHQRRLQAMHQVGLAASTVLDPAQLAKVALDEILTIFGAERAFLFLQPAEGGELEPYLGRTADGEHLEEIVAYGSTLVRRVYDSGEALVVTGSEEGEALGSHSTVVHGLRSIMVAPLLLNRRRLGVVYLDSRTAKGIFTADDVDILAAITNHVAASLETARAAQLEVAVHAAERARDIAESLRAAMSDFAASLDPAEVGSRLAARVAAALPDTEVRLLPEGEHEDVWADAPLDSGVLRRDPARRTPADRLLNQLVPAGTTDWLAVPLLVRGDNHGVLLAATHGRPYDDAEVGVVAALAGQGATALDNAALFRRVEELATRDGLTGLYNRRHFFELGTHRLQLWERYHRPVAAIMIDIDHFKSINDTHGHAVGDDVIREVAHRLAATMRETDLVCRYGGEEFAVLLPETPVGDAVRAAERLHQAVCSSPIPTQIGDLPVTVSVGLAGPNEVELDVHVLLRHADEALYSAKRGGRNRVASYGVD